MRSTGDSYSLVAPYTTNLQAVGDIEGGSWCLESSTNDHRLCPSHSRDEESTGCVFAESIRRVRNYLVPENDLETHDMAVEIARGRIAAGTGLQ